MAEQWGPGGPEPPLPTFFLKTVNKAYFFNVQECGAPPLFFNFCHPYIFILLVNFIRLSFWKQFSNSFLNQKPKTPKNTSVFTENLPALENSKIEETKYVKLFTSMTKHISVILQVQIFYSLSVLYCNLKTSHIFLAATKAWIRLVWQNKHTCIKGFKSKPILESIFHIILAPFNRCYMCLL